MNPAGIGIMGKVSGRSFFVEIGRVTLKMNYWKGLKNNRGTLFRCPEESPLITYDLFFQNGWQHAGDDPRDLFR